MISKKDFGEKPEFLEEDLAIEPKPKAEDDIKKLKDDIQILKKAVHDRGMEVGLPSIIMHDIGEIAASIDAIKSLLMSSQLKKQWTEEDEEYRKKLRMGEYVDAFYGKERQVNEIRSAVQKLEAFLYDVVNRMKRLQARLVGKEIIDYEYPIVK